MDAKKSSGTFLAALLLAPAFSFAAALSEGMFVGQIQQFIDDGKVSGCGVTISAVETPTQPGGTLNVFNGSISLMNAGGGLVKGRAAKTDAARMLKGEFSVKDITPLPTEFVWLKGHKSNATENSAASKVQRSDDPGYIIYGADFDSITGVFDSILDQAPIQVGVRAKNAKYDTVLFGAVKISNAERDQLLSCLSGLMSNLSEEMKER
mgnify:CR=1 FL=1